MFQVDMPTPIPLLSTNTTSMESNLVISELHGLPLVLFLTTLTGTLRTPLSRAFPWEERKMSTRLPLILDPVSSHFRIPKVGMWIREPNMPLGHAAVHPTRGVVPDFVSPHLDHSPQQMEQAQKNVTSQFIFSLPEET